MMHKMKYLLLTALFISVHSLADEIKPSTTYTQTFDNLTPGTYRLVCNLENPNHYIRSIDMNVTVNGDTRYTSLPNRYNTYSQDFIRAGNKIKLLLTNLDTQYAVNLIQCEVIHTYN